MSDSQFPADPPLLIDQQQAFDKLLQKLKRETILAVDTEANSLFAYQEQVCLIQISTSQQDYILDPLRLPDIQPLGALFTDPGIEKVLHASEYDLMIMFQDLGFEFQNLFDTMLAAQILGRSRLGLDALLEELAGIKLNKKYQRANWGKRPLPEDMLRYAQMDTHYLIKIRHQLADRLERQNLSEIAQEDFKRACRVHLQEREEKLPPCWRIMGSRKLTPRKAAVLEKLCQYRDETARKQDLPVFKVLGGKTLLALAQHLPVNRRELLQLDIPGQKAVQRHADGLLSAIQAGLSSPPIHPPRRKRLDDAELAREKALRKWRKTTAANMGVNSAVILPRDLLADLVASNPASRKDLASILQDVPWRLDRFGDSILSVIHQANQTRSGR